MGLESLAAGSLAAGYPAGLGLAGSLALGLPVAGYPALGWLLVGAAAVEAPR